MEVIFHAQQDGIRNKMPPVGMIFARFHLLKIYWELGEEVKVNDVNGDSSKVVVNAYFLAEQINVCGFLNCVTIAVLQYRTKVLN
jgi:hypothetical protein